MKLGPETEVSIVIPTRNEERALGDTLQHLWHQEGDFEVLLVDGNSTDRTREVAAFWAERFCRAGRRFTVLRSPPGRARQMNRGGRESTGAVLLFLHADTHLPSGALRRISDLLEDRRVVGGGFAHRFREKDFRLGWVSRYSTWRGARRGCFFGDQAPFVRRNLFLSLGGFHPLSILEDLDFSIRLRRLGKVGFIPQPVSTSARRFQQVGVFRSLLFIGLVKGLFRLGFLPVFVVRRYREIR